MRSTISIFALMFFTGCGGMQGDWKGGMNCDGDSSEAQFKIGQNEFGETTIDGGFIGAVPCSLDDSDCNLLMSGIIYHDNPMGEQDLQIDLLSCKADGGSGGSVGFACEDPEAAEWDGRKEITFYHQTSGGTACTVKLERQ